MRVRINPREFERVPVHAIERRIPWPWVTNRGRLVVVAFPDGLVASYESELPVWRPEPMNTKLWSQPLFVVSVVLIAVWQFYRQKARGPICLLFTRTRVFPST